MPTSQPVPLLSCLPTFDPKTGDLTVVIETPKGSPNKYDYDSSCGAFRFVAVLPEGNRAGLAQRGKASIWAYTFYFRGQVTEGDSTSDAFLFISHVQDSDEALEPHLFA
jgi:hypothetical protein